MESLSFASLSLMSILAGASAATDKQPVSQSVIQTHISPAIAGSWVLQLPPSLAQTTLQPQTPQQLIPAQLSKKEPSSKDGIKSLDIENAKNRLSEVTTITTASTKPQADCTETYTFAQDNKMWSVSGAEWTHGRYVLSHQDEGLPLIAINTLHDNNAVDCSGNQVDQTGEMMLAYVDYESDRPYMYWCADKEGKECFMTFKKQLP